jgi:Raf kinase inhibitor-like YbhB/YbcL family protein
MREAVQSYTSGMQSRAAVVLPLALVTIAAIVAACNDDGRTLRPPRSDQIGSVSTLAPITEPTFVDDGLGGAGDDGLSDGALNSVSDVASTVPTTSSASEAFTVAAPFADGGSIDARYTCEGEDVSPALSWSPGPPGAAEIAITMVDLDAPDFVHWAIAGIDPLSVSLGEGVVPEFALVGINGTGQPGYTGPCPPAGETHSYRIRVHYLAQQSELGDGAAGADLIEAIDATSVAVASVVGTYSQS